MLNEVTVQKLLEMRLSAMAEQFKQQMLDQAFHSLSFEERFGLLTDAEWARRKNNRLARLIRKAELHFPQACIEDLEYHADRRLDKQLITRLSTCNYIGDRRNIIVLGASGAGKTYMACAFGIAACRNFYTTKYIRLPELLIDLAVARSEGSYRKLMNQYKKYNLLVIDEWLLIPLVESEARDLLEIIEARHQKSSTIFSSQFAPAGWHAKIGEETLADAILDRIVHDSYTIVIEGKDSMRNRKGIQNTER
ncbi:MAG: Insertion sequence IS5376 putative ATP-binding protein [Firmicutes bacterium]|nr:Insertion sequence IS5376 putative ATP-binding protein [Bacillota bacterium]